MSVQALTAFDPRQFFSPGSRPELGNYRLNTQISALSVSREYSGRLDVSTADGDRISVVADVDDEFQAGSFQSSIQTPQGTGNLKAGLAQSAHAHSFGVSVSGDLDEGEVTDLEKLFEKVSGIFRGFFQGQDEGAKAQILQLADGIRGLESVSSLDLSVHIVRAVTVVSASDSTPGGAPGTAAVIPQSSTGTTAPTPSPDSFDARHLAVPVSGAQFAFLVQQVLDAVNELQADLETVRQQLPAFLDQLRPEPQSETAAHSGSAKDVSPAHDPSTDRRGLLVAYQSVTATSFSLSLQV